MKTVKNILSIIGAVIISGFLVGTLMITPILHGASAFITKETFISVLEDMDYASSLSQYEELVVSTGFSAEDFDAILKTDAGVEIMSLCISDIFIPIEGADRAISLTEDKIIDILTTHAEELRPYTLKALEFYGLGTDFTNDELDAYTVEVFKEYAAVLPSAEELGLTQPDALSALQMLQSGGLVIPMLAFIFGLSVLIVVLRLAKYEGMIWLAISYALSGGLVSSFGKGLASELTTSTTDPTLMALTPMLQKFADSMNKGGMIILVCAVIFVVVFFVGRKLKTKKQEEIVL